MSIGYRPQMRGALDRIHSRPFMATQINHNNNAQIYSANEHRV
jgi:hypothetical protein